MPAVLVKQEQRSTIVSACPQIPGFVWERHERLNSFIITPLASEHTPRGLRKQASSETQEETVVVCCLDARLGPCWSGGNAICGGCSKTTLKIQQFLFFFSSVASAIRHQSIETPEPVSGERVRKYQAVAEVFVKIKVHSPDVCCPEQSGAIYEAPPTELC